MTILIVGSAIRKEHSSSFVPGSMYPLYYIPALTLQDVTDLLKANNNKTDPAVIYHKLQRYIQDNHNKCEMINGIAIGSRSIHLLSYSQYHSHWSDVKFTCDASNVEALVKKVEDYKDNRNENSMIETSRAVEPVDEAMERDAIEGLSSYLGRLHIKQLSKARTVPNWYKDINYFPNLLGMRNKFNEEN